MKLTMANASRFRLVAVLALAIMSMVQLACDDRSSSKAPPAGASPAPAGQADSSAEAIDAVLKQLSAKSAANRKDGIAAAILIDTSGSMSESVADADGTRRPKIEIARRCVLKVVKQADGFAREQPDLPTVLGVYEFSVRGNSLSRQVLALRAPDPAAAEAALLKLRPEGGTPIGQAMIQAKRDLDAAGLSRMHILIVTDGENTSGTTPGVVMAAVNKLPESDRPGVYFVAFDVAASVFKPARDAGAMVLPAANEQQLQTALDELVGGKILLEK